MKLPPNTNPTLHDVAHRAGVSTATVSRVLNDSHSVRAPTRRKVEAAIEALGYAPNFGARALAAKHTKIIGAVIPTMENAIFAAGIQAFQTALARQGFTLLVASSAYRRDLEEQQIYNLVSRGVDALLLIGEDRDEKIYQFLQRRKLPYVIAWNIREDGPHRYVGFDNFAAARIIAAHILDHGHRNIAVLAGITSDNDRARNRLRGICQTISAAGVQLPNTHIIETPYQLESAGDAFERLLAAAPRPSAVICGNDVIAVGAILRAKKLGLSVPDDISITGFDDIDISAIVSPPLTTMHVPHRQMGQHAAQMIMDILATGRTPQPLIKLESHIIERQSVAPPAKR